MVRLSDARTHVRMYKVARVKLQTESYDVAAVDDKKRRGDYLDDNNCRRTDAFSRSRYGPPPPNDRYALVNFAFSRRARHLHDGRAHSVQARDTVSRVSIDREIDQ